MKVPFAVLITSAVSQAVSISDEVLRRWEQGSTVDSSRLQTLKWRIRTEKLRSEEWCNNVAINKTIIEPERMTAVREILVELREANNRISGRLNKYGFDKTTSVSRRLVTAAKWNNGGYEDAEDLADLMRALNDCLVTLVPPLPSYSGPMHQDTQDNRSNAITPISPAVDPSSERDHPIPHTPPEIYSLYRGCVVALRALGSQDKPEDSSFMKAWHRFSLWGGNVFRDKAQALDDLLAAEARSIARGYIISLLIDCLVILEFLLARSISMAQGLQRDALESCKNTTRVALIGESITLPAIERWYQLQAEEDLGPRTLGAHIDFLGSYIDQLFKFLPTIRALKHQDLLLAEIAQTKLDYATGGPSMDVTSSEDASSTKAGLGSSKLEQKTEVEILDIMHDNLKKVRMIPLQSPLVEKSRIQLEQWFHEASLRRGLSKGLENHEIRKVHEALSRKLDHILPSHDTGKVSLDMVSKADMDEVGQMLSTALAQTRFVSD